MNKRMIVCTVVVILLLSACNMYRPGSADDTNTDQITADTNNTSISQTVADSEQAEVLFQGLKETNLTVDKLIATAPYIFEGVCLSKTSKAERGMELTIQVQKDFSERLKESEMVIVRVRDGSMVQIDSSYLFFTEAYASVYERVPLMYQAYAMVNSQGMVVGEDYYGLASYSKTELEGHITKTLSNPDSQLNWHVFGAYCTSEDPKDIYEFSTHVLIGQVEAVEINAVYDRTSYWVSVKENLKGKAPDRIVVVAFKDSLKVGESYLLLLSGYSDPGNYTYTLSGVDAVFPPDYEIR